MKAKKVKVVKLKKKYAIILVIALLGVFAIVLGTSYAFFTSSVAGKEYVVYAGNLEISYEKKTDVINLPAAKPMTNEEGLLTTPYSFDVKNIGTLASKYQIRLEEDTNNTLPLEYVKISVYKNDTEYLKPTKLSDLSSTLVIVDDGLLTGMVNDTPSSDNYKVRMWVDINAGNDMVGKEFKARIVIDGMQNVEDGFNINTRPIITLNKLNGNTHINLVKGDTFTDPGVESVKDDKDVLKKSDVTTTIEYYDGTNLSTVDSVNTNDTGVYYITYSISDNDNLEGKTIRIVTVNNEGTIPAITLNGSNITIGENGTFTDPGVTVGTNIQVATLGEVKNKVPGVYTIKYIAIDANNNNMNSVTRTVTVVPKYRESLLAGADPVLTDNLVPVTIDSDGTVHKADITSNWYSYQNKNWANAVVLRNNQIEDLSGHRNDATIHGATLTNEGLVFDGVDDYAVTNDVIDYNSTKELTIEFEAKLTKKENNNPISILFESSNNYSNNANSYSINSGEAFSFHTSSNYNLKNTSDMYANSFQKYTITVNTDNEYNKYINIYTNGIKQDLIDLYSTSLANLNFNNYILNIGSRGGTEKFANMTLKNLKIYTKELTQQEITNNINGNTTTDNLILHYDFTNNGLNKPVYNNNEVIPEDSIESYFVWIPKYSYQLWNLGNYNSLTTLTDNTQTINIKFGTTNTSDSNSGECTTPMSNNQGIAGSSGNCVVGDYMTHPAFLAFDTNGIWVGKFETGYNGATSTAEAQVASNDSTKLIIKPNVYSWRSVTAGNMFKASYDYLRNDESHMMKNTEWGAVAYLGHSAYGSATSVRVNNNSAYITGYAATEEPTVGYNSSSIDGNRYESTTLGASGTYTKPYNTSVGYTASTTGNITGVYDMSGGAWEYVMGYTTGASTEGGTSKITTIYPDFLTNSSWSKYYDKYTATSTAWTEYNNRILGDATGEMGPFASTADPDGNSRYKSSWYQDYAHFVGSSQPWFYRGGYYIHGVEAGSFAFNHRPGGVHSTISFRLVLAPTE